jgi:hypothetical protein
MNFVVLVETKFISVGFEVFTVVVMKSIIFWDMMPCSPLSFNRCFGGTYLLHLQGRRNRFSKTSKQGETQWTTRRHIPKDDTLQNSFLFNMGFIISFTVIHNLTTNDESGRAEQHKTLDAC